MRESRRLLRSLLLILGASLPACGAELEPGVLEPEAALAEPGAPGPQTPGSPAGSGGAGSTTGGAGGGGTGTGGAGSGTGGAGSGAGTGTGGGTIPGAPSCPLFPADNPWNRDVSADPVDPNSAAMMAAMNAGSTFLHPDFGSDPGYGIPWITVAGTQPRVPVSFDYPDESDPGPYPIPATAPIEPGDGHVIVIDRDSCKLYETYDSRRSGDGWTCGSGAIFDLRSNALRPDGWTSADAAGLPIFPGLVRRDEVSAGAIRHALRFTVKRTRKAYVHPATHFASSSTDASLPPMGARVRLKASFDLSRYSGGAKVILAALKKYGMLLADNGSDWFITGERNPLWNDEDLNQLKGVPASAFEVVKLGTVYTR